VKRFLPLLSTALVAVILIAGCTPSPSPAAPATPEYAVVYDANGGQFGTAPVDTAEYEEGASVTVLGRNGLVRGGHAFAGWNTAPDGEGTAYAADDAFVMGNEDVTLYADWTPFPAGSHSVIYLANGASAGSAPIDDTPHPEGESFTVYMKGDLALAGHLFRDWNTDRAGASGVLYEADSDYPMGTSDIVLYAQWSPPRISFSTGGGSSVARDDDGTAESFPVSAYAANALEGWHTGSSSGPKVAFPYAVAEDTTLYAQWLPCTDGLGYAPVTGGYSVSKGASAGVTSLVVPAYWLGEPVVAVADEAFKDVTTITAYSLPDGVETIGDAAFSGCTGLTYKTLSLPSRIKYIGDYAFYGINSYNISFPTGLLTIGDYAFQYNNQNTAPILTLPDTLATIGQFAFADWSGITAVTIPASVNHIGSHAFGAMATSPALKTVNMLRAAPPVTGYRIFGIEVGEVPSDSVYLRHSTNLRIHVPSVQAETEYQASSEWSYYSLSNGYDSTDHIVTP